MTTMLQFRDVPGRSKWFDQGNADYQKWIGQRDEFFGKIQDTAGSNGHTLGETIFDELISHIPALDTLLTPSGIVGWAKRTVQGTKKLRKQRITWEEVFDTIFRRTYSVSPNPDEEFVYAYPEVSLIWIAKSEIGFTSEIYRQLHAAVDTELRVGGKIRVIIDIYPTLAQFTDYKLRQYKHSVSAHILYEGGVA